MNKNNLHVLQSKNHSRKLSTHLLHAPLVWIGRGMWGWGGERPASPDAIQYT